MALEQTLILAKPDAVRRSLAGEILARFERRGFRLRAARFVQVDKRLAEEHYAEHEAKPFFGELVEFITSGPTLAFELGCGTAYFSARLARLGARGVGVDVTPAQLETAQRMQEKFGLVFPLIEANAEAVPLPDASFDLVHSEYGASIWCDPYKWIPEA